MSVRLGTLVRPLVGAVPALKVVAPTVAALDVFPRADDEDDDEEDEDEEDAPAGEAEGGTLPAALRPPSALPSCSSSLSPSSSSSELDDARG